MKIVDAGFERITEKDPVKKIEQVARVCYKSEDKIKEGSAEKMVKGLVRSKHYAMLEHGSVAISLCEEDYSYMINKINELKCYSGFNSFLRYTALATTNIVSGNFRAWREFLEGCVRDNIPVLRGVADILFKYNPIFEGIDRIWLIDGKSKMSYSDPVEIKDMSDLTLLERLVHEDVTIKWICDRGVSHEIVRHRVASFAQESTRYCNYGESGDVVFIDPSYMWRDMDEEQVKYLKHYWQINMEQAERAYMMMLDRGATPQMARSVLPNSLKTEVVMTASLDEWVHFFSLRALGTTGKPHPQMEEIAKPAMEAMVQEFPFLKETYNGLFGGAL